METISAIPSPTIKERILSIDVIRGLALMGILLINICSAGLPDAYDNGAIYFFNLNHADYYSWFIVDLFADGKMRCLFSMLFGAGVILFTAKRDEQGLPVARLYYRRMLWLLAFGIIDTYIILFLGDILMEYAAVGLLLFFFRKLKPKYLLLAAFLCLGFLSWDAGKNFFKFKAKREAYLQCRQLIREGKTPDSSLIKLSKEWVKFNATQPPFTKEGAEQVRKTVHDEVFNRRQGYVDTFLTQAPMGLENILGDFSEGFWETLSAMLIGMALFKGKFFSGGLRKKAYWIIAAICLGIGLPLAYESTWLIHAHSAFSYPNYIDTHSFSPRMYEQVPRLFLAIGYASLLILCCISGWFKKITYALSCVGRMAFTNYLTQNLLYTFLFFGHGLAMFALFTRMELYYILLVIWALQITFSIIWLRYYKMGPLEWLWRSLTYKKIISNRIKNE